MTTSIQHLNTGCLLAIFRLIPADKREKLEEVCKLFQRTVLDPYFEKERTTAKNIGEVALHYPKELVRAIGGPQALFNLNVLDLSENDDPFFYAYEKKLNPMRAENHRFIVFQIESTDPIDTETVMLKKKRSGQWIWQCAHLNQTRPLDTKAYIKASWPLDAEDVDYLQRLFSEQTCCRGEGDGPATKRLIKNYHFSPKQTKQSNPLLAD